MLKNVCTLRGASAGCPCTGGASVSTSGSWGQSFDDLWGLKLIDAPAAWDVAVDGDYAYVAAGWSGLVVIDVSVPAAASVVGLCSTPGWATGVAVTGGYDMLTAAAPAHVVSFYRMMGYANAAGGAVALGESVDVQYREMRKAAY